MSHPCSRYLGRVPFAEALRAQDEVAADVHAGRSPGLVLGFESEPVITLGLRATDLDVAAARVPVVRVDRGGRATLHNPGQLVIFPVWPMAALGSRAWVDRLIDVTRATALALGHALEWREESPGLYAAGGGKVAAIGLRIRRGVSTHGVSINLSNALGDFDQIRACGVAGAPLAHLGTRATAREVFARWADVFADRNHVT